MVFRAADWVARKLVEAGITVDIAVVRTGALLHDVSGRRRYEEMLGNAEWNQRPSAQGGTKKQRLTEYGHGRLGAGLIRAKTFRLDDDCRQFGEKVAKVVLSHDRTIPVPQVPETLEGKIVLWADHVGDLTPDKSRMVTLEERFSGIRDRWVKTGRMTQEQFDRYKGLVEQIQDEIFNQLLKGMVKPEEIPNDPNQPTEAERELIGQIRQSYPGAFPNLP